MFSWLDKDANRKHNADVLASVADQLKKLYKQKLYPLEEFYKFHDFHSPGLDDAYFDAKPMVLVVGQQTAGKTTFIRYLLEQDFPGMWIGPEPTTDRFIAVMHGEKEGVIPGNALVVDTKRQFRPLSKFGNAFLNRFQCSQLDNEVLNSISIIDSPGILSGEKQRLDRGYDFCGILEWFAERVDRIILLFDAHKLDISDEFKRCIEALKGNEDKIRIVLNKADMVDHQQMMRVHGALMWSLGKVFKTPEVSRVYIGSFWDQPLRYDINRRLFVDEQCDLFADLQSLPRNVALRKLNDLIKRARLAKVHAFIISYLKDPMPAMIGKEKRKKELIQGLPKVYETLQREHNISPGDFPDMAKMQELLEHHDFSNFNPLKQKLLDIVEGMLGSDIARLMSQIPLEEAQQQAAGKKEAVGGGVFTSDTSPLDPKGTYPCLFKGCDDVFNYIINRTRHERFVHGVLTANEPPPDADEDAHVCKFNCGRRFSSMEQKLYHETSACDERPVTPARAASASNMSSGFVEDYDESPEKPVIKSKTLKDTAGKDDVAAASPKTRQTRARREITAVSSLAVSIEPTIRSTRKRSAMVESVDQTDVKKPEVPMPPASNARTRRRAAEPKPEDLDSEDMPSPPKAAKTGKQTTTRKKAVKESVAAPSAAPIPTTARRGRRAALPIIQESPKKDSPQQKKRKAAAAKPAKPQPNKEKTQEPPVKRALRNTRKISVESVDVASPRATRNAGKRK